MQKQRMKCRIQFKFRLGNPLTPRHVGSAFGSMLLLTYSLGFKGHHFTPFQQGQSQHNYMKKGHTAPNVSFLSQYSQIQYSLFKGYIKGTK